VRWTDEELKINTATRATEDGEWKILEIDGLSDFIPLALDEKGEKLFLSTNVGDKQYNTVLQLDLSTQETSVLFEGMTADVLDYDWDPQLNMPVIGKSMPGKTEYHYAPVDSQVITKHQALVDAFGGQNLSIASQTKDGSLLLLHVSSDVNPGEYYMFDTKTNQARFLWANRSWLDPRTMANKTPIAFEASDGMEIKGYLTLPKGTSDKPVPLIVMNHGGPHGPMDSWEFESETQLFANRGFAVLQVNFRGSGGYGHKFMTAGYRNWGTSMIQDILDGTEHVIQNYPIDASKMCVYGASYGGYASLMATVRAPDMFKCVVGYVGVYDC
jgi:predicted acyl esterase